MVALDNGYDEGVLIVSNANDSSDRLCRTFGFERVSQSVCDPAFLALHDLDPSHQWSEIIVSQPDCDRGRIRLLQQQTAVSPVRRMGAQFWDLGGFTNLALRALGPLDELLAHCCREGFSAIAPVTGFNMAGLEVREVLARDSDGVCLSMAQRIAPPLQGWDHVRGPASNPFNSVITVDDIDEAKRFFVDALGWKLLVDTELVHEDGRNVMGLPVDLARAKPVKLMIVQQQGQMQGSVELIEYPCEGLDFRDDQPHFRGIASICFPVSDLAGVVDRASEAGCVTGELQTLHWPNYGTVTAQSVITKWSARLAFFQPG